MKTIKAHIEGEKCIVASETPTDVELNEHPAYKNWEKLRSLGWEACTLANEERDNFLSWHFPENDIDKLEIEFATYDYYYEMSDDGRVWDAGQAQDNRIRDLKHKVGKDKYTEIATKYIQTASKKYREPEQFIESYTRKFLTNP